jgi:hypothetical protein
MEQGGSAMISAAETVRGPVEALGPAGIRVAGRWWPLSPALAGERPEVGQLVVAELAGGAVVRLTCIASPDPDGCPPAGST